MVERGRAKSWVAVCLLSVGIGCGGQSEKDQPAAGGTGGQGSSGTAGRGSVAGEAGSDANLPRAGGGAGGSGGDAGGDGSANDPSGGDEGGRGGEGGSQVGAGRGGEAGGDGDWTEGLPACEAPQEPLSVKICVVNAAPDPEDPDSPLLGEPLTGTFRVASVTANTPGCGLEHPFALELTSDTRGEWLLYVEMPEFPEDLLQVDQSVELAVDADASDFAVNQTVVVSRDENLVLFGVNWYWPAHWPDLSPFGISVQRGEAYCAASADFDCTGIHSKVEFEHDGGIAEVGESERQRIGDFSFAVELVGDDAGPWNIACDPPGVVRFGGFAVSE
jgi:hypothetical protein